MKTYTQSPEAMGGLTSEQRGVRLDHGTCDISVIVERLRRSMRGLLANPTADICVNLLTRHRITCVLTYVRRARTNR